MRTNNKLNPHMTPSRGIEPGPHWWEASALTTAPTLLPEDKIFILLWIPRTADISKTPYSPQQDGIWGRNPANKIVAVQIIAMEQCFSLVLFIILHTVVTKW